MGHLPSFHVTFVSYETFPKILYMYLTVLITIIQGMVVFINI